MSERFDLRILAEGAAAAWEDAPNEFNPLLRDCSEAMIEAADEIERLRADIQLLRPEAGFGQVFDDYVETVAIVTEFWKAGSLRARVQSLADDRERLQLRLAAAEARAAYWEHGADCCGGCSECSRLSTEMQATAEKARGK